MFLFLNFLLYKNKWILSREFRNIKNGLRHECYRQFISIRALCFGFRFADFVPVNWEWNIALNKTFFSPNLFQLNFWILIADVYMVSFSLGFFSILFISIYLNLNWLWYIECKSSILRPFLSRTQAQKHTQKLISVLCAVSNNFIYLSFFLNLFVYLLLIFFFFGRDSIEELSNCLQNSRSAYWKLRKNFFFYWESP